MHLTEQLREFLHEPDGRFEIDNEGERADLRVGAVTSPAVLLVQTSTDALKLVAGGRIEDSVDRDEVWEVVGFSLDRELVGRLLEAGPSHDLLSDVAAVGVEWEVIDRSAVP